MLKNGFGKRLPLVLTVFVLLLAGAIAWSMQAPGNKSELTLLTPPFLQVAHAQTTPIGEKLDEEAGISAWYQASGQIELDLVESSFRTIEIQTPQYLIGSVDVPNYPEKYDVHVYVHVNGWILAYYMNDETVSKMVDVKGMTLDTTHLKNTVAIVAGAAGYPVTSVNYYDFRYPNATNILLVAENYGDGNFFDIQIPSAYAYYERSWALADFGSSEYFTVDGVNRPNSLFWDGGSGYGSITAAQFVPDTTHTITVDDFGVLVIVYRVP